jgi:hypothetical protein
MAASVAALRGVHVVDRLLVLLSAREESMFASDAGVHLL